MQHASNATTTTQIEFRRDAEIDQRARAGEHTGRQRGCKGNSGRRRRPPGKRWWPVTSPRIRRTARASTGTRSPARTLQDSAEGAVRSFVAAQARETFHLRSSQAMRFLLRRRRQPLRPRARSGGRSNPQSQSPGPDLKPLPPPRKRASPDAFGANRQADGLRLARLDRDRSAMTARESEADHGCLARLVSGTESVKLTVPRSLSPTRAGHAFSEPILPIPEPTTPVIRLRSCTGSPVARVRIRFDPPRTVLAREPSPGAPRCRRAALPCRGGRRPAAFRPPRPPPVRPAAP